MMEEILYALTKYNVKGSLVGPALFDQLITSHQFITF